MQVELTPWLLHQVVIAQRKTRRDERNDWLFADIDGRKPLQYSIGLTDDGRSVRVEIAYAVNLSGKALAEAERRACIFAAELDPKSRWKIVDRVGGLALRTDVPFADFSKILPGLMISSLLREPGRRWREFLDALPTSSLTAKVPSEIRARVAR